MKSGENPSVEFLYAYLMVWFVLHCPKLMKPLRTESVLFVRRLEELNWTHDYLFNIGKIPMNRHVYGVFCCLPSIPDADLGEKYEDVSSTEIERLSSLYPGLFLWLMNIWPGYMVLSLDKGVIFEPYMLSRFACQCGYDQLYVGNPNLRLQCGGAFWTQPGLGSTM